MKPIDAHARLWLAVATFFAFLVCVLVVLIPVAEQGGSFIASLLRFGFSPACHQIADRCLNLGAGTLPICARCGGLYAGGFAGLLIALVGGLRNQVPFRWLLAAAAPSVIDFALGLIHLPTLGNWPRFGVALLPGFLAGLLLADAICEIAAPRREALVPPKIA